MFARLPTDKIQDTIMYFLAHKRRLPQILDKKMEMRRDLLSEEEDIDREDLRYSMFVHTTAIRKELDQLRRRIKKKRRSLKARAVAFNASCDQFRQYRFFVVEGLSQLEALLIRRLRRIVNLEAAEAAA